MVGANGCIPGQRAAAEPAALGKLEVKVLSLGVLLLIATAALTADIIVESDDSTQVTVMGHHLTIDDWRLFVAGMIVGAVALLALRLFSAGLAKDRHRRGAARRERRANLKAAKVAKTAPAAATVPAVTPAPAEPVAKTAPAPLAKTEPTPATKATTTTKPVTTTKSATDSDADESASRPGDRLVAQIRRHVGSGTRS